MESSIELQRGKRGCRFTEVGRRLCRKASASVFELHGSERAAVCKNKKKKNRVMSEQRLLTGGDRNRAEGTRSIAQINTPPSREPGTVKSAAVE